MLYLGMLVTKTCVFCFSEFQTYRDTIKYCSSTCAGKGISANNPQCKSKFSYTLEMFKEAEEKTPLGESRAEYIYKKWGGTEFTVIKARKKLGYQWLRRNYVDITRDSRVYFRRYIASLSCCVCGESRAVDGAHIHALHKGGPDTIENLLPLCPTHHFLFDKNRLNEKELKLISDYQKEQQPKEIEAFQLAKALDFGRFNPKGKKVKKSDRRWNQLKRKETLLKNLELLPEKGSLAYKWLDVTHESIQEELNNLPFADIPFIPRPRKKSATIPTS